MLHTLIPLSVLRFLCSFGVVSTLAFLGRKFWNRGTEPFLGQKSAEKSKKTEKLRFFRLTHPFSGKKAWKGGSGQASISIYNYHGVGNFYPINSKNCRSVLVSVSYPDFNSEELQIGNLLGTDPRRGIGIGMGKRNEIELIMDRYRYRKVLKEIIRKQNKERIGK